MGDEEVLQFPEMTVFRTIWLLAWNTTTGVPSVMSLLDVRL